MMGLVCNVVSHNGGGGGRCRLGTWGCPWAPAGGVEGDESDMTVGEKRIELREVFVEEEPGKGPIHDFPSLYRPLAVAGEEEEQGGRLGFGLGCPICGLCLQRELQIAFEMKEEEYCVPVHISLRSDST